MRAETDAATVFFSSAESDSSPSVKQAVGVLGDEFADHRACHREAQFKAFNCKAHRPASSCLRLPIILPPALIELAAD
jgi:hypothetical protein